MTSGAENFDIIVVGGGPAGCATAIAAGRHNLNVLVLDLGVTPGGCACAGWLGPAAVAACEELGIDRSSVGAGFAGLRLRSWDFKECVEVDDADLHGWIVDPDRLRRALLEATRASGAQIRQSVTADRLHLGETSATLDLTDGSSVAGQVVIIADGASSRTASMAQLRAVQWTETSCAAALGVLDVEPGEDSLDVVLGAGRALKLAAIARSGHQVRASLMTHDRSTPPTQQLDALLHAAKETAVIPATDEIRSIATPCLAGAALEIETHVGKRSLVVGDAGGFVAAFSGEALYPALRSGWLAAETAAKALQAPVFQDELALFGATWRADLADYLRMPNTDLGLLMPMVFKNPQMSKRVASAFLLGRAL